MYGWIFSASYVGGPGTSNFLRGGNWRLIEYLGTPFSPWRVNCGSTYTAGPGPQRSTVTHDINCGLDHLFTVDSTERCHIKNCSQTDITDRCQKNCSQTDITDRCQKNCSQTDITDRCHKNCSQTDITDRCQKNCSQTDITDRCQKNCSQTDITDRCQKSWTPTDSTEKFQ